MFRTWLNRLIATFLPNASERRLEEEFTEHLEVLSAQQSAHGLNSEEARQAAHREFGSVQVAKEQYRDQARFRTLENIGRDLRFALRQCRKNPAFTAAAVLSLALGIGANTALFSFVNAILLKQLPVPEPKRLAILNQDEHGLILSYQQVNALNRDATSTEGILGTHPIDVSATLGDGPQWISAELVTGDYFRTLQVKPERGRLLTQRDLDDAAGNPTCVISYQLWQSLFNRAEDVVGRKLLLNARAYEIIGVSQRGFHGTDLQRPADLLIPATRLVDYMPAFVGMPNFDWKSRLSFFSGMVRLKSNASRASAGEQLTRLNRDYFRTAKINDLAPTVQLTDGRAGLQSSQELVKPASILLSVSLVVLLIACANLATLLLSRTSARSTEFALRLAIGGSRRRIVAQVLIESALLAVLGTAAGFAVAYAIKQMLLYFLNRTTPEIHQLHIALDGTVLFFVAAVSSICVLLFGSAPALQAARSAALGSSAGNARTGSAVRKAFVVAQIALSFIVVLCATLLVSTLRNLKSVDLGFHPDEIAAVEIRPAAGGYSGREADRFYARIVDHLRSLPGIRGAATAFGSNHAGGFKMQLMPTEGLGKPLEANGYGVNAGYFGTFGARILAGRDFDARDTPDKPQVYIISQHLAERYFHGQNPIGRSLKHSGGELPVIGVVSDIRDQGVTTSLDTVYQDAGQLLSSSLTVFARCSGACSALLPTLRSAIQKVDSKTPILSIRTLKTEMDGAFSSQQALGFLCTLFATLALLLVGAGIYGVLSYMLTRRTREMGIRMALGASAASIAQLFLKEAVVMIALGTLIGVPCALASVTLLQSQLFGIAPHDPKTLSICILCIVATIGFASISPIRRALRIAPQQALRTD
jgi:predicted permease